MAAAVPTFIPAAPLVHMPAMPAIAGPAHVGFNMYSPVLAPTVIPTYTVDTWAHPTANVEVGTLVKPGNTNRQVPIWAHPSSQAAAAVYLGNQEKWPRIAGSGALQRRGFPGVKTSEEKGYCAAGGHQSKHEADPTLLAPAGLPPAVPQLPNYNIVPIQPFITPLCIPQQF